MDAGATCADGADCSAAGTITPKKCQYGYYQDATTKACVACPANYFCYSDGLVIGDQNTADVFDFCPAGYECTTATPIQYPNIVPTDSTNYHMCPKGYWCDPSDSSNIKTACLAGTYRSTYMGAQLSDCFNCPFGYTCANDAAGSDGSLVSICAQGTFCAASSQTAADCTQGHACPQGSGIEYKCPWGTY